MYLIDTNVLSALRASSPNAKVAAWLKSCPPESIFVSVVTLGELQQGVERLKARDPSRASQIEAWIDQVAYTYNFVPMNGDMFRAYARLMHHHGAAFREDAMIAATAITHGLIVATRNVRDFKTLGVKTYNPFDYRG
ncbi:MAG: type II toxin-antitoxin system VapC family toxin [Rhodospirillaceae bacterium]|nr:type II toxin-antitoxin system VapC family toxin [Rhodospirillaceae bacterium]